MLTIANTNLTNTFDYWRSRTNELATAMSTCVVTTDANTSSTTAVGNASITGTFTSNNQIVNNNIFANTLTVNSVAVSAAGMYVGNSTTNTVISYNTVSLANSSSTLTLGIPTTTQVSNGQFFLNANGSWAALSGFPYLAATTFNTVGVGLQLVDSFNAGNFTTADYIIHVRDNINNIDFSTKIFVMALSTGVQMTEYAQLTTGSSIGYFNVTCDGTTSILYFTPTNGTTSATIRFVRITT